MELSKRIESGQQQTGYEEQWRATSLVAFFKEI